jgi:hypothetical protein
VAGVSLWEAGAGLRKLGCVLHVYGGLFDFCFAVHVAAVGLWGAGMACMCSPAPSAAWLAHLWLLLLHVIVVGVMYATSSLGQAFQLPGVLRH